MPFSEPGTKGTPAFFMCWRALVLEPIISIDSGVGPMNLMPASRQARGKARVLREKAVAGMDRLGAAAPRHVEDLVDVEVRLARRRWTDVVGVVGLAHVQRLAVHVGEDGDRLDAHLAAGANDADGDFAAVGDQNSFEHESAFSATESTRL